MGIFIHSFVLYSVTCDTYFYAGHRNKWPLKGELAAIYNDSVKQSQELNSQVILNR